ncbi:MAG: flagellar export protein FliJ [Thiobacillaceae bacterium]
MAKRFPLQPLLEHARHRMDAAERTLELLKQKEDEARQRLAELEGFRQEYHARLANRSAGGMHIQLMRDYHAFLAKIEDAIRHQAAAVEEAHARWQMAHRQWLAERQKVKAYETLAQRHHKRETLRAERLEQRLTDEHAARLRLDQARQEDT